MPAIPNISTELRPWRSSSYPSGFASGGGGSGGVHPPREGGHGGPLGRHGRLLREELGPFRGPATATWREEEAAPGTGAADDGSLEGGGASRGTRLVTTAACWEEEGPSGPDDGYLGEEEGPVRALTTATSGGGGPFRARRVP